MEDAEPVTREVLELIRGQALPYLDATGNLTGYIAATEKLALEQPANFLYHAEPVLRRLATGDINGAQQAGVPSAAIGTSSVPGGCRHRARGRRAG